MRVTVGFRRVVFGLCVLAFGMSGCGKKSKDKKEDGDTPSDVSPDGSVDGGTDSGSEAGSGSKGIQQAGAPVLGTGLAFSNITHTGFNVSWGAAKDPIDLTFTYKVVYASEKTDLDTIEKAEAITGSAATAWLPSTTTTTALTGLTLGKTYAVAVLVKNSVDLESLYAPVTQMTMPLRVFVTKAKVPPVFNAAVNADNVCNGDDRKPSGSETYKALISATWRIGCSGGSCAHNDWPLKSNTTYAQPDGTLVASTNGNGLFNFPLTNLIEPYNTTYPAIWSGMDLNWSPDNTHNCMNWTDTSNAKDAYSYDERQTQGTGGGASPWSGLYKVKCDTTAALLCIEQ